MTRLSGILGVCSNEVGLIRSTYEGFLRVALLPLIPKLFALN